MAMNMECCLASFPKFAVLPTEVRLLIWQHALPAPRIIYISENTVDDVEELGGDEEDLVLSGILLPSRLYSAQDFALERSCVEARELVASRYKPIACAPTGSQRRIWNGFASTDAGEDTESAIAWPEDIRVDLSRDILFVGARCVAFLEDSFKVPGLDWPRILNETQRLAIDGEAFITLRMPEEKDSTRGNSMVDWYDREYEIFDDVEANTLRSVELLQRFKNVREIILSFCGPCCFFSSIGIKIRHPRLRQWEDWALTPCPLSSLPTSDPAIDPAARVHANRSLRKVSSDPRIKLRAFRLRGVVQALEEEKTRGRLEVEKIRVAAVVSEVTATDYRQCCRPTGQRWGKGSRVEGQDIKFL